MQVAAQELLLPCWEGQPIHVERLAAIHPSRDWAISDPLWEAVKAVQRAGSFEQLLESHRRAWAQPWRRCDIQIGDSSREQCILRLHIFHLLQTVSRNAVDRDVDVPARGWHGEAFRDHVLWNDLFLFPFFNLRIPPLTCELLLYRYRWLNETRWAAKEAGCAGAMYPWQSGNEGLRFNPQLPDRLARLRMRIHYRNHGLHLCFTHQKLIIASEKSWARPIHLGFCDDVYELHPGESRESAL